MPLKSNMASLRKKVTVVTKKTNKVVSSVLTTFLDSADAEIVYFQFLAEHLYKYLRNEGLKKTALHFLAFSGYFRNH